MSTSSDKILRKVSPEALIKNTLGIIFKILMYTYLFEIEFMNFQIFQVFHIIVKFAISPRPAAWILERSLDGKHYDPWRYFAVSDDECKRRYGVSAHNGSISLESDSTIICSTKFSKLHHLQKDEVR